MTKRAERAKVIELREKGRLSFDEILRKVKVSKSTLSLWLRGHPLTPDELSSRRSAAGRRGVGAARIARGLDQQTPYVGVFSRQLDPKLLHRASVAVAIEWFMRRGYTASIPIE